MSAIVNTYIKPYAKLRITTDPDINTKGSELVYTEEDANWIAYKNAIAALDAAIGALGDTIPLYDPSSTYASGDVVRFFDGAYWGIYQANASILAGQTPGSSPSLWNNMGYDKAFFTALIAKSISDYNVGVNYKAGNYISFTPDGIAYGVFQCILDTTAGQDPVNTPNSWGLVSQTNNLNVYNPALPYVPGQYISYRVDTGTGINEGVYICRIATTPGDNPLTTPTKWRHVSNNGFIDIARADLQTLMTGGAVENTAYRINDAVGGTMVLLVFGATDRTILTDYALSIPDGAFGTYNIGSDVFTPFVYAETDPVFEAALDTDTTLSANSDTKVASQRAIKTYVDAAVVGLLDDRGNYDASVNLFPSTGGSGAAGAINKGDIWYISVAGTLGGVAVTIGSSVRALVDTPGQTSSSWDILNVGLGYVPENVANKSNNTSLGSSTTLYPTQNAVKVYADTKASKVPIPVGGDIVTTDGVGNTTDSGKTFSTDGTLFANSNTLIPTQAAVKTYADTKQAALGFTPENVANKSTNTSLGSSNTLYPSQNAVKVYVDTAVAAAFPKVLAGSAFNLAAQTSGFSNGGFLTGGSGGTYRISAYLTVTAISAGTVTLSVIYNDENGTSRTINISTPSTTGVATVLIPVIRTNGLAITIFATFAGVSCTYDCGAVIEQLN